MQAKDIFKAIEFDYLPGVIKAICNGCDVNEKKPVSLIFREIEHKCYKDIIEKFMNRVRSEISDSDVLITPLIYSMLLRIRKEIVGQLIHSGADVSYSCGIFNSLIWFAFDYRLDSDILVLLINHGIDVNICDSNNVSPLMHAIISNYDHYIIQKLVIAGSDVNVHDNSAIRRTPLMYISCKNNNNDSSSSESEDCGTYCRNKKIASILLEHGADVNSTDSNGNSALHGDICPILINLLCSNGAHIDAKNNKGMTALMSAVCRNDFKVFKTLLSLGASPNCCDNDFNTPLHKVNKEIYATLLLYYGALQERRGQVDIRERRLDTSIDPINIFAIVKYCLVTKNERFIKSMIKNYEAGWLNLYIKRCNDEISVMKRTYINNELSFYDLCLLKITKNNKYVAISEKEYDSSYDLLNELKIFSKFIRVRLDGNRQEQYKFNMIKMFSKLEIKSVTRDNNDLNINLNYDCLYEISRYLDYRMVYNLFLAATLERADENI